ncbi:SAM-dependent methyltransferase [Metallumcola ferriviriculae]|uniref:SAM-dependent methyltransferase n=1 Tax=Metallumcola ferriviriculae TaxID=3039180 RepID=A0AAU0UNV6_9FIRM|nr:SAM-dependent methyltransferase [Desulfitibacteraceae bacterium MK1]
MNKTAIIKEFVTDRGKVTFRDFMEQALYHPQAGYYTAHQNRLGREGDFYTSVHVSYLFGAMVARQAAEMYEILGCPQPFTITEFGAGDGMLAKDILDWLKEEHYDCFQAVQYRIVEISSKLSERQKDNLAEYSGMVSWYSEQELLGKESVQGVVLTNELIDAFPVHILKYSSTGWQEAWVEVNGQGQFIQQWGEPSRDFSKYFQLLDWQPRREGQVVEVNMAALAWLETVSASLTKGFVITIDYGRLVAELDDPRFAAGTLLCYHQHKVVNDPLQNVGRQDITSHANFTALMKKGEELKLSTTAFMYQANFLLNLGIMKVVEEIAKTDNERAHKDVLAVKRLAFPGGMGETFRVLIQHKGVDQPQLRCQIPFHKQIR